MEAVPADWRVSRELPPHGKLYEAVLLESLPVLGVHVPAEK